MSVQGVPHDHAEFVEGCFRCDLSQDEVEMVDRFVTAVLTEGDVKMVEAAARRGARFLGYSPDYGD